jgi:mannose-6-phosphate isomerase-like protein (cupin superfamily)
VASPTPISRRSAPHYFWQEICEGWRLVDGEDLSVIHERMPPGTAEERHRHSKANQFFFVLSGQLSMALEGELHHIGAQEGLSVPAGAVHQARNDCDAAVEFLVISAPTTRGDRMPFAD